MRQSVSADTQLRFPLLLTTALLFIRSGSETHWWGERKFKHKRATGFHDSRFGFLCFACVHTFQHFVLIAVIIMDFFIQSEFQQRGKEAKPYLVLPIQKCTFSKMHLFRNLLDSYFFSFHRNMAGMLPTYTHYSCLCLASLIVINHGVLHAYIHYSCSF